MFYFIIQFHSTVTHNVEDGEDEEEVVEDAVHPLPRERPDGDAVAEDADDADDQDEQALGRPLKFRKDLWSIIILLKVIVDLLTICI